MTNFGNKQGDKALYNLKICHLYPDALNMCGDSGNIIILKKRMEWRGYSVEVETVSMGETFDSSKYDIVLIGSGQNIEQDALLKDLQTKKEDVKEAIENGVVFLCFGGGYQILGSHYINDKGEKIDLIGALDFYTKEENRLVGDIIWETQVDGETIEIIGFENHSGHTYLGENVKPLGKVIKGNGNNGDGFEGARYKNAFCCYTHGPLFSKNPTLCDYILKIALERKYKGEKITLTPLDDVFETQAHNYMKTKLA